MPAVWFPYNKMGKTPAGMAWDTSTKGEFGPFAGQLFVADQNQSCVMRVFLEKVDGHWQGACFPFRYGFQCGIIRASFGKDHSLFVGMSNAGWGARGNKPWGLQRLVWTGKRPFEINEMRALSDGFELTFTEPVEAAVAADVSAYTMTSYTYRLRSDYGGPEEDVQTLTIAAATVSPDGQKVTLRVDGLRAGYVHELHVKKMTSTTGQDLLHREAYYTLVNIPK